MLTQDNCQDKSDEELVKLTLADQEYFLCIIKKYHDKLMRYVRRISGVGPEEAEDVLQEVFLKTYRNLNDFDAGLKFSSWIYRIAHNQVISDFRKRQARPQISSDLNEIALDNLAADLDIAREIDGKFQQEQIGQVMRGLKDKYKQVLILKFFEEKSYQEISDIIKKPIGTVGSLLNKAKADLRNELNKQDIKL